MVVPELAAGAALDLAPVRAACDAALASVLAARPDEIVVIGAGQQRRRWGPGDHGSFAGYGLDVPVSFGPATGRWFSDLSLLVAAWLLERATGSPYPASGYTLPVDAGAAECRAVGRRLAGYEGARRVAVLAMGDAAGCRAAGVPGAADPVADEFDRQAATALRSGDPAALGGLDAKLAGRVSAPGWVSWQVLAGALAGRRWRADLLYSEAPLEVRYLVAAWRPA